MSRFYPVKVEEITPSIVRRSEVKHTTFSAADQTMGTNYSPPPNALVKILSLNINIIASSSVPSNGQRKVYVVCENRIAGGDAYYFIHSDQELKAGRYGNYSFAIGCFSEPWMRQAPAGNVYGQTLPLPELWIDSDDTWRFKVQPAHVDDQVDVAIKYLIRFEDAYETSNL